MLCGMQRNPPCHAPYFSVYFYYKMVFPSRQPVEIGLILLYSSTMRWLWLFSHDGKVRILNRDSRCASWVTQCTHGRSNCEFWITQCTHERRILDFAFQREKNVWVPCQSNMHGARISCASVHMQLAVYRRKLLEGHTSSAPQNTI